MTRAGFLRGLLPRTFCEAASHVLILVNSRGVIPNPTRTPKQMASTQLCCKRPKGKAAIRPNKIAFTVSRFIARLLARHEACPAHGKERRVTTPGSGKLGHCSEQIRTELSNLGLPIRTKRTYCELRTNRVHCFHAGRSLSGPRIRSYKGVGAMTTALRLVEGSSMDKSKALDAALSQIERNFGKGSIMRLGKNDKSMDVETVSTGSLGLDIALGIGGLPRGRVVEIYGPESSGK